MHYLAEAVHCLGEAGPTSLLAVDGFAGHAVHHDRGAWVLPASQHFLGEAVPTSLSLDVLLQDLAGPMAAPRLQRQKLMILHIPPSLLALDGLVVLVCVTMVVPGYLLPACNVWGSRTPKSLLALDGSNGHTFRHNCGAWVLPASQHCLGEAAPPKPAGS